MDRTTSHAKSVEGLHYESSALDRVKSLSHSVAAWFARHAPAQDNAPEPVRAERRDAPALAPGPSGSMRFMPTRNEYQRRMLSEALRERAAREQTKTRDLDRGR